MSHLAERETWLIRLTINIRLLRSFHCFISRLTLLKRCVHISLSLAFGNLGQSLSGTRAAHVMWQL
jgi:hypothetical protein